MDKLEDLGKDVKVGFVNKVKYEGNEAELFPVTLNYKKDINGILQAKKKDFLLRNCIIGGKEEHNQEIITIYDSLVNINKKYKLEGKEYKLNIVPHLTDIKGNIYIKNINSKNTFNVYDLIPDSYYIDLDKKQKSKFKDFKDMVKELNLNKAFIITKLFEQLAILHANNFVVGEIDIGDRKVKHPTLSLFLYRLKNSKGGINEELFIHDIHNLKLLENPKFGDYVKHCVSDIKNMSFDIIRFFKGIGLPQGGFKTYADVLKELNPDLYKIIYSSFLRDPRIEIEIGAIENIESKNNKSRKTAKKVIEELEISKKDKINPIKSILSEDNIFFVSKTKEKIINFFDSIKPENTEIIIDFDNTLTYPGSVNSLNIGFGEDMQLKNHIDDINYQDFLFRMGAISFLKLLSLKGYKIKIHSLGFNHIISKTLEYNGITFENIEIFANSTENIKYNKQEIQIDLDPNKRKLIIGDSLIDFDLELLTKEDLKVGFLNENCKKINPEKKIKFNGKTDFYFINFRSDFIILYNLFRYFLTKKS